MQQGMLFHSIYAPESGVNIQQIIGALRHELNPAAFHRAWQCTLQRHEVLRTAFQWDEPDQAVQEVYAEVEVPFQEHDWRGVSEIERERQLEQYLAADRRQGFVLSEAPLLRVALFRWSEAEYRFVWTFHHALLDGLSFGPVIKEVFAAYASILTGASPQLPAARPFREFVEWLQTRDFSGAEPFWRGLLQGIKGPTSLNLPKPQVSDAGGGVGAETLTLPRATTARLREFAEGRGGLSVLVQGAWALLLSRYSGEDEVVFGVVRSCRRAALPGGADPMVGLYINTVPVRVGIEPDATVHSWLNQVIQLQVQIREHQHTPLLEIQKWSGIPAGTPLFESILVFNRTSLQAELSAAGGEWERREFRVIDQTNLPLTLLAFADSEFLLKLEFDRRRFDTPMIKRLLGHLSVLMEAMAENPQQRLSTLPMLTEDEEQKLLVEWNQTQVEFPRNVCIHELFEAQARRSPDAPALAFEDEQITYRETERRAERLARHLRSLGVGPEVLVGICVERSIEMVIGLLGILKAGGAYVPLDPGYPAHRLAHMIADSQMPVLVTQRSLIAALPAHSARVVCLEDMVSVSDSPGTGLRAQADNLAYVIYTSGSTGKPKGVMLTHRNVVNFFAGMDRILGSDFPGTWLAVTSISFDISVLELLWTLARGFKVVIYGGEEKSQPMRPQDQQTDQRKIDFSLFYFSGDEGRDAKDKYRLLLEGAKFADEAGLAAVWTPERHFHAFGGLYPNPSVTSAAIAAVTKRIAIRAGSVVLPLHNPIRVAEEWAMVDNLSQGRVGISFASGWHSNDFVFAPDNYPDRKKIMFWQIETFRKLWRGEAIASRGGDDREVSVAIRPRPVQREVPIWITASGSPETFRLAGEMGANLLTNLLGQTVEEVGRKIKIYREAWREHGHGREGGQVTLMLHTFVGPDLAAVREKVREPFTEYLKTSVDLIQKAASAWSFAAFNQPAPGSGPKAHPKDEVAFKNLSPADMRAMLDHAFERYFETSGLFGTPASCLRMVNQLKEIGVDEIACLIDFGVDTDSVLAGLEFLKQLNLRSNAAAETAVARTGIGKLMCQHGVTHLQCTPSLARMLVSDPEAATALQGLRELLVGGEALSRSLADQLLHLTGGNLRNMYGPTETAIWSATELLAGDEGDVPIGRPLANTEIYILDRLGQAAPVGLPGELCIGGEGVARGYLNLAKLTAERFIPHPFRSETSARLYRTGDLARYRADGTVEFLGRIDHQVKVRGHRIELGEIESTLTSHASVAAAVVVAVESESSDDKRLVAYIVPKVTSNESGTERRTPALLERGKYDRAEQELRAPSSIAALLPGIGEDGIAGNVTQWREIWEETYESIPRRPDPTFNLAGWKSSYTGEPMPEPEMREWVDRTVERILALQPAHVLELGCGTGLLLFRIAPHCSAYCGVDFSESALNYLRQQLPERDLSEVTLRQGTADAFDGLDAEFYDTVILNSVVQYFPDIDYLLSVLERSVGAVMPGGRIFIGDVRSLPLLEAFHASLEMAQCPAGLTREDFRRRVASRMAKEEELVIDPAFFRALPDKLPQISQVEIHLKSGGFHNELTRFRYDVILHVDDARTPALEARWIDFPEPMQLPQIRQWLAEADGVVGFAGMPNARLHREIQILHWLAEREEPQTVGEFRDALRDDAPGAVDPEDLLSLGRELGFEASFTWSGSGPLGTYDAVFRRGKHPCGGIRPRVDLVARRPWNEYANRPARARSEAKLAEQLRTYLRKKLPEVMVPSAFVMLDALPLTPNGKVDRRRLPAPDVTRPELKEAFVAPRTPVEEALAAIWRALLGLEKIGVADNFFELGGHSLLATQLVSRLREVFQVEVPLRVLFDAPTIGQLAQYLGEHESQPGMVQQTAKIFNDLERMSPEEVERAIGQQQTLVAG